MGILTDRTMAIGLLFALLAVLCGNAVVRAAGAPLVLAPLSGLAAMAVLATWTEALGTPPLVRTSAVVLLALAGLGLALDDLRNRAAALRERRLAISLLVLALSVPALMLGTALAGVETPVSPHDGAFHVEAIDSLRQGLRVQTWYPMGFHTAVAAVLGLAPWLDSARGTFQAAEGLAVLAPLAAFSLGTSLGLEALLAAVGALVISLTWIYPYDYHLWGGWPQGMGVLLAVGLWTAALHWLERPTPRHALLAALFAGAIVLTHGIDLYSAALGLMVIAVARQSRLAQTWRALSWHLPLALGLSVLVIAPYLATLLGWAGAGGATQAGEAAMTSVDFDGRGDLVQFVAGVTGAASLIDMPLRLGLIVLGLRLRRARLVAALWLSIVALLAAADYLDIAPVRMLFIVTYPWLDHDRPRQVAVLFASLLTAAGILTCAHGLARLRDRLPGHRLAWRRLAIACGLLAFFFAEGSGVSIYKRLASAIAEQNVYSNDDAAAMAWLRQHVQPGEVVANDLSGDAGIWAPYKADVPILLPRSATGTMISTREPILDHLLSLDSAPGAEHEACALHVNYLFHGAPPRAFDERLFPDRGVLEQAPELREVFASGEATVFRIELPCT